MSVGELMYLVLIVATFLTFMIALGWVSRRPRSSHPREQRGSRIATNQLMGQNSRIEAIPSGYGERRTYDLHRR